MVGNNFTTIGVFIIIRQFQWLLIVLQSIYVMGKCWELIFFIRARFSYLISTCYSVVVVLSSIWFLFNVNALCIFKYSYFQLRTLRFMEGEINWADIFLEPNAVLWLCVVTVIALTLLWYLLLFMISFIMWNKFTNLFFCVCVIVGALSMNLFSYIFIIFMAIFSYFISALIDNGLFVNIVLVVLVYVLVCLLMQINTFLLFENSQVLGFTVNEGLAVNIISTNFFSLDFISIVFVLTVIIISIFTFSFSVFYMKGENEEFKFNNLLLLFVVSMLWFLCSASLFMLVLGWELIGIVSFLLINFWHTRNLTLNCAFKAFLFNNFSDACLLIFSIFILRLTGSADISSTLEHISLISDKLMFNSSGVYFLLYAVSVKSAQICLHIWLIESMEAPVPASAMIHSATLVTAGIFLILIFFPIICLLDFESLIICVGAVTACFTGVSATAQTDLNKLLAYSTISNCGLMLMCCGLANLTTALLFVILHGLFNAGLFFCTGYFVNHYNTQDIRHMGYFISTGAHYYLLFLFCLFNLVGAPLSIAYFSNELLTSQLVTCNFFVFGLGLIASLSSLVYSYSVAYSVGLGISKSFFNNLQFKILLSSTSVNFYFFGEGAYIHLVLIICVCLSAGFSHAYFTYLVFDSYITYTLDSRVVEETFNILADIDSFHNCESVLICSFFCILSFECFLYNWFNQTFNVVLFFFSYLSMIYLNWGVCYWIVLHFLTICSSVISFGQF